MGFGSPAVPSLLMGVETVRDLGKKGKDDASGEDDLLLLAYSHGDRRGLLKKQQWTLFCHLKEIALGLARSNCLSF